MRVSLLTLAVVPALVLAVGCSGQNSDQAASQAQPAPAPNQTATGSFTGQVVETMDSGGYTYARIENGGQSVWAAAPTTELENGTEVTVSTGMPMKGFHSETLDRTFDTLYFVSSFEGGAKSSDPHAGMDMGQAMDKMGSMSGSQHGATPSAGVAAGSIEKAEGGHTVAELYAAKSGLVGSTTTVRGKVVKYNAGIMGKNWIHVQDGTGEPGAKTHDLLVTTNDTAKVGDVITVSGTVSVDKDFGAGYEYDLLLENASVQIESSGTTGR